MMTDNERSQAKKIRGYQGEIKEVEQIIGRLLGMPRYCDDPVNFPYATEADGVCVGDHTAVTLAMTMAKKMYELAQENYVLAHDPHSEVQLLRAERDALRKALLPFAREGSRRSWVTNLSDASGLDDMNIGGSGLVNGDLRAALAFFPELLAKKEVT